MKNKPKGILETLESQIQSIAEKQDIILSNQIAITAQINALLDTQVVLLKYVSQLPASPIAEEMLKFIDIRLQSAFDEIRKRNMLPESEIIDQWRRARDFSWFPFDADKKFKNPTPHNVYDIPNAHNQQD